MKRTVLCSYVRGIYIASLSSFRDALFRNQIKLDHLLAPFCSPLWVGSCPCGSMLAVRSLLRRRHVASGRAGAAPGQPAPAAPQFAVPSGPPELSCAPARSIAYNRLAWDIGKSFRSGSASRSSSRSVALTTSRGHRPSPKAERAGPCVLDIVLIVHISLLGQPGEKRVPDHTDHEPRSR